MTDISSDSRGLLDQYVAAARGYEVGMEDPESDVADKYCAEVEKVFVAIKSLGDKGLEGIARLLNHDSEGVRLWASAHLLNYKQFDSLPIIQTIAQSGTVLSLVAEVTLGQWRKGALKY